MLTIHPQTDALRRHQKSRCVLPRPPAAPLTRPRHNGVVESSTPSVKGKERALPQQGPSSYYRSHTATTSRTPYPPHPHPVLTVFSPALPTSAEPSRPVWQDAAYYHSPHYRPHTSAYHTGHSPPPRHFDAASASTSRNTSSQPPNTEHTPCIDPALDDGSQLTAADVVAAVRAVLLQAESEEKAKKQREEEKRLRLEQDDDRYDSLSLRRPEPMEHILTEDGEPMLNPGPSSFHCQCTLINQYTIS